MRIPSYIRGVTLIELMIVIVIVGVLAMIAVPAFREAIDRNRLKAATENLYSEMQFAKAESIKRNEQIFLIVSPTSTPYWQYYLTENNPCTLNNATATENDDCEIDGVGKLVSGSDYPGVTISTNQNTFSFSPLRGTLVSGTVTLTSARQKQMKVITSGLGRVRICSPSGGANVAGYSTSCP